MILDNLRTVGCALSRKVVISVGNGVLKSRCPEKMAKNGRNITLSIKWARGILQSVEWVKRRGMKSKRAMNPALDDELVFSWKKEIADLVLRHNFPEKLILNLEQTPSGLTSAAKVTFTEKRLE